MTEPASSRASTNESRAGAQPFTDRVAVVTGGTGGIGRAISDSLENLQARVVVIDRSPTDAGTSIRCDVRDAASVGAAFREVESSLGSVELLINTAGVVSEASLEEMEEGEWDRVLDINLKGTFLCCQAAVRQMRPRGFGRIVNFSSGYAVRGYRHGAHYAAAKAGIIALTKSLALEVAADGINVNAVAPGPVDTPMLEHLGDARFLEGWKRSIGKLVPKQRIAEPADLVGPTLFLLGPDSEFMTGQTIHVNGGMTMVS